MAKLARLLAAAASLAVGASAAGGEPSLTGEADRLNNQSLLWGPYKPNLYFGVRPRVPKGLWTGLMWGRMEQYEDVKDGFRYTCEQGPDMHGYGWDEYDARTGGVQSIHDEGNNIDLTTSFVKVPGGQHGGSWAARIRGRPRGDAPETLKTTVYYYIAQEGEGDLEAVVEDGAEAGLDGDATFRGWSAPLGNYSLVVTKGDGRHPTSDHEISAARPADKTVVFSQDADEELLWQAKALLFQQLQKTSAQVQETYDAEDLPPPWQVYRIGHRPGRGNVHMVQKTFEGPFEFDVIFSSGSAGKRLTSAEVTQAIRRTSESFGRRFSRVFELQAPFRADKYQAFAKSMFSNLLGGVGYFHGEQLVDRSYAPEYDEDGEGFWAEAAEARARGAQKLEGPYELLTSVPSRPFFPRGFLWDEGFHLMAIADWDLDLALEMVESWFGAMDEDGWIPREQILGAEARSKVPEEFQVQYPHYANPPTLFLVVEAFVERLARVKSGRDKESGSDRSGPYAAHLERGGALGEEYLRRLYPLLRRQYDWFRRTQRGEVRAYEREAYSSREAYRWRGRTETHCLTSGLDDYPRPQPPHPGELHVDLLSWVGLMTRSLMRTASALGMAEEASELGERLEAVERNLADLHWSEREGCYCDATIDEFEEHRLVCHKGYVSLFPLLAGLLRPDEPRLGRLLELMGDERQVWSAHGLRSLSRADELYGTGENYWRSPVWMPLNYMAVTQLHSIATTNGPFQAKARELYGRLRRNLVETVYKSWAETG
ncbi:hypothetical protein CDD83_4192 [Cordyceps sp. RAO-2017]|nr:hypothetical protein CDD83_4192 [Cordyceps sp. RAO-2017]